LARGVRRAVVQGVEVVVDGLDLGPLDDGEAEPEEDVLELAPGLGDEVQAADGLRRVAGERDVDAVGDQPLLELGGLELGVASGDRVLELAAGQVGRLADAAALGRLELGHAAQQVGQLGLASQPLHARLLERARGRRLGDGGARVGGDLLDAVDHGRVSSSKPARSAAPPPCLMRVSSYSATVAAMAALRDSEAIGMWAMRSHAATTSSGSPVRSAPTTIVAAARPRSGWPARATSATRSPGSSSTARTRARGTEKIAPIDARTALGPEGSAV